MKAYVVNYVRKPENSPALRPVLLSKEPKWIMDYDQADTVIAELDMLRFRVTIGVGGHRCFFGFEELSPGKFAVVCRSHPDDPNVK